MRRSLRYAPLLALLALTLPALAQGGEQGQDQQQAAGQLDTLFVQAAADGDMYEIESSQVVIDTVGDDQELADLAQRIIDDHVAASERLQELAADVGAEMPPEMSAGKRFKVEQLRALSAEQLVQAYLLQQEIAHIDAITLYTAYAQLGQHEGLRAFAEETLPTLQEHLQMVQSLRQARPDPAAQDGGGQEGGEQEGGQDGEAGEEGGQ